MTYAGVSHNKITNQTCWKWSGVKTYAVGGRHHVLRHSCHTDALHRVFAEVKVLARVGQQVSDVFIVHLN